MRPKRCRTGVRDAVSKSLVTKEAPLKLSPCEYDEQLQQDYKVNLPEHQGYGEQGCCEFLQMEEYGKQGDRGQGDLYEGCRQHHRKRPRRVTKPLVDLSEYEKFCIDPACTVRYHLPCEVSNVKRQGPLAMEDLLRLSVAEVVQVVGASAIPDSQEQGEAGYEFRNEQLHFYGLHGDREPTTHEQKLMDCKLKIMETRLNHGVDVWSLAAQLVNPYEVLSSVAVRVLNRAFFKMWELMQIFPGLVPLVALKPKLLSAHICEGPGGFVQSVCMHRMQEIENEKFSGIKTMPSGVDSSKKKARDCWFAITLATPGNKDAALRMQMPKLKDSMGKSVEGHVHYGADQSGDVTNPKNISSFVEFVLKQTGGEKMHLITGDGAFDVSEDFSSQEQSHAHLFFCEILLAARLQSPGGALVLKVFDCFTETTTALLYILTSLYSTVEIVRLRTSRVCNSERFIVAQGFQFLPRSFEDKLMNISTAWYQCARDGVSATLRMSRPYPHLFLEALNQGNAAIANDQSESILQAVAVAEHLGERLSFTNSSHHKGILSILRRKMKTVELLRTNALALCETLNIPLANLDTM